MLTLGLSDDLQTLVISGDTQSVWKDRRTAIFLRDHLAAKTSINGSIEISARGVPLGPLVGTIEDVLAENGIQLLRSAALSASVAGYVRNQDEFSQFSSRARAIWANQLDSDELRSFANVLADRLPGRRLYKLQLLAAYHLAFAQNAANFSAPGAGKTSIVFGAFAYLNSLPSSSPKHVNRILTIGPLSSFGPWELEFKECFGRPPRSFRLSGGVSSDQRKRVLYSELPEFASAELILTSYQNVPNDLLHLQHYLRRANNKTMIVLDEAHKIKNVAGGKWAEAVLELAGLATSRVVLTGTPAPNGYEDLYNLFKFIWPEQDIIKFHVQHLRDMSQSPFDRRIERLVDNVQPFFIRIRKSNLGLPVPLEHPVSEIRMGLHQQKIYRFIEDKYVRYFQNKSGNAWTHDVLTRARLIRLMQAATNPALLKTPLDTAIDDQGLAGSGAIFVDDADILSEIQNYQQAETPAKLSAAAALTESILSESAVHKVVVWCVFVQNLFAIQSLLSEKGINSRVVYGGTPTESEDIAGEIETRESIIREFHDPDSSFRVIIANPFAVGESISLHKVCRHAIYLERNFNAAAFLQSKDRIHRYGLPTDAVVNYYYLASERSVDLAIHHRLLEKEAAMNRVLESREIPLISFNLETDATESDADDIRAILDEYAKRNSEGTSARK